MADFPLGFAFTQVSAILLAALGGYILSVRPRTRVSLALGAFTTSFGLAVFFHNLSGVDALREAALLVAAIFYAITAAALAVVAFAFPRPLTRAEWPRLVLPAIIVALWLLHLASAWTVNDATFASSLRFVAANAAFAVIFAASALFGVRFARSTNALERQQYALMAAGLLVYGTASTYYSLAAALPSIRPSEIVRASVVLASLAAWLAATRGGESSRPARLVIAVIVVAGLAAFVLETALPRGFPVDDTGFFGAVRLVSIGIFAYAIVRHSILGLDVRVNWTLKRGTVAAVFVGAFFVASQVAENFFSQTSGPVVGGLAAGLLLFAIAPIQRVAERLANRAVPVATEAAPSGREAAFRAAVRLALKGGRLTREDDLDLMRVADELGLSARRALELKHEMESPEESTGTTRVA